MTTDIFKQLRASKEVWGVFITALLFTGASWVGLEKQQLVDEIKDTHTVVNGYGDRINGQDKRMNWQERKLAVIEAKQDYMVKGIDDIRADIKKLTETSTDRRRR